MDNSICYCIDIDGLLCEFNCKYKKDDWRFFIDAAKFSLKAVLLHNGNKFPSIPLAHAVGIKDALKKTKKDCLTYAKFLSVSVM